jgi:hypothetical protein
MSAYHSNTDWNRTKLFAWREKWKIQKKQRFWKSGLGLTDSGHFWHLHWRLYIVTAESEKNRMVNKRVFEISRSSEISLFWSQPLFVLQLTGKTLIVVSIPMSLYRCLFLWNILRIVNLVDCILPCQLPFIPFRTISFGHCKLSMFFNQAYYHVTSSYSA